LRARVVCTVAVLLGLGDPAGDRLSGSVLDGMFVWARDRRMPSSGEFRSFSMVAAVAAGVVGMVDEAFMADTRSRNPVMRMSGTLSTPPKPLRHKAYGIPCR